MARINIEEADQYTPGSNSEWFSLENDGDIATVQFLHDTSADIEVYACHTVSVAGKDRLVDCLRTYNEPIENCPFCAAGMPVKPHRFVLMYQHEDGKVKIWERGKQFISKLQGLFNRYSPLSGYVFEIERHGKKGDKDTRYEIFPMDRKESVDVSQIERPNLLGGIILSKEYEEMEIYLDAGVFPTTEEEEAPAPREARRAQVEPRGSQRAESSQQTAARGPSRGSRAQGKSEVF